MSQGANKNRAARYPGKAGYADVAGAHDRPLSSQGVQRAPYVPVLFFLQRRSPEIADGQIEDLRFSIA